MLSQHAWYGFLNKSHILQINSLFKRTFKYGYVKSVYKLEPCHASSASQSQVYLLTYEILDMACRSVLSNLNCIKRHLLTRVLFSEFY